MLAAGTVRVTVGDETTELFRDALHLFGRSAMASYPCDSSGNVFGSRRPSADLRYRAVAARAPLNLSSSTSG
jgi:hypothetical protein